MNTDPHVIGVDYGTDSVRSIIVNATNGKEVSSSVFLYPRWKKGLYCNASENQFRQHPLDYIEGLEQTIKDCLAKTSPSITSNIKAISIDTTGSSPVAVDDKGQPLALNPKYADDPNAMFVLWKDHTSVKEALEINEHAKKFPVDYLKYVGGIYSSEWFWAKLLHVLREGESLRSHIASWVEHCDWIPYLLTGETDVTKMKRGVCSAGHKALWAEEFGGFPPNNFFATLDPLLDGFTGKLFTQTYTADKKAGTISNEWAQKLGLPNDVIIGVGAFDAHMGAVGGQIEPYHLSKVMGTSTCDMMVVPIEDIGSKCVKGICGQVNGSIIPGMMGLEAGQSGFGDIYAWFRSILEWPLKNLLQGSSLLEPGIAEQLELEMSSQILKKLSEQAAELPLDINGEMAVDWMNGRRTPDANQQLEGGITHLNLGSTAPRIFYSLVESTCFGAKAIVDRFNEEGIPVKGLIGLGGVAKKSPFIMQMMADVMNMPIRIHKSEQTCALGAAMFAATSAGIYDSVELAMEKMGPGFDTTYFPNKKRVSHYKKRYKQYRKLGVFLEKQAK